MAIRLDHYEALKKARMLRARGYSHTEVANLAGCYLKMRAVAQMLLDEYPTEPGPHQRPRECGLCGDHVYDEDDDRCQNPACFVYKFRTMLSPKEQP